MLATPNVTGDTVKIQQLGYNNEGNTPGGSSLMIGEVQVFAVPEPASLSLALLGGGAILLRRRRK